MTIAELKQHRPKLEENTLKTQGCHWWQGTKDNRDGRGRIRIGKKMKNVQVLAWELFNGEELPEGMVVKSSCENKLCVRGEHLELGRKSYAWRA